MAANEKNTRNTTPDESAQQSTATSQQSAQNSLNKQVGQQSNAASLQRGGGQTGFGNRSLLTPLLFDPASFFSISPFALMRRFTDEMDQMFENFGSSGRDAQTLPQRRGTSVGTTAFAPQVELFERDDKLIVRADLPGLTKEDVQIEITDDALVLTGERRYEHEESRGGMYRTERSYGTFTRRIPLPEGVDAEQAKATFQNGVLEIALQIPQAQSRTRQIQIEDASPNTSQSSTNQTPNQTNSAPNSNAESSTVTVQSDERTKAKSA